MIFLYIIISL